MVRFAEPEFVGSGSKLTGMMHSEPRTVYPHIAAGDLTTVGLPLSFEHSQDGWYSSVRAIALSRYATARCAGCRSRWAGIQTEQ